MDYQTRQAIKARRAVAAAMGKTLIKKKPKNKNKKKPKKLRQPPAYVIPAGMTMIEAIVDAQGDQCLLCGNYLSVLNPTSGEPYWTYDNWRPTFEHVTPKSRGGRNIGNRLVAHLRCNQDKADRMPTGCELIWLAYINARLKIRIDAPEDSSYQQASTTNQGDSNSE